MESIEMKIPVPMEDWECKQLVKWLDARRVLYTHFPAGEKRDKPTGKKLKAMGLKAGILDYLIFDPPPKLPHLCGTVLEMKRQRGGAVSGEQQAWLDMLGDRHWYTYVARGFADAIRELEGLGY